MTVPNIREITKKEKIKGLTRTSWTLASTICGGLYPYLVFKSFLLFGFLVLIFYIIEYFDDDIVEIYTNKFKHRGKNEYFG